MTPVRLEPGAPRSIVKHSSTGPLRSHLHNVQAIEDKIRLRALRIIINTTLSFAKSISIDIW